MSRPSCADPSHAPTPDLPADAWGDDDDAMIEAAWGLIANAWDAASQHGPEQWHEAALRWRDRYGDRARTRLGMKGSLTS